MGSSNKPKPHKPGTKPPGTRPPGKPDNQPNPPEPKNP